MSTPNANHLKNEKSPYLQQHMHNPVDWYPWGKEALERAKLENKPIFLSIGYSTCHWCHVMAHESFENQEIADFLNRHFISIKVDREERPGIDQIYMAATQAMTGSGGWPMSVFLFPDTRPFYAGTYFPPEGRYGSPGFMDILKAIHKAWKEDQDRLALTAEQITSHLRGQKFTQGIELDQEWPDRGFKQIADNYDGRNGGFGRSQKFPRPVVLEFLLRYYKKNGARQARDMAIFTLDQMAAGGIYDHLGGGFHRYAVDRQWRVPHFEKMLYDQAQMISIYLSAFQLNHNPLYKQVAADTIEYVLRDLGGEGGGFYSAEDADSINPYNPDEHGEGAFYLWTEQEIRQLLTPDESAIFIQYFGIEKNGNAPHDPQHEFSGRNILYIPTDLAEVARNNKVSDEKAGVLLTRGRDKLLAARQQRTPPHLDDKILTAWNGLMISALARGGMILDEKRYLQAADKAADFIIFHLKVNGELKRRYRDGEAGHEAGLDDYAFFIQGLLDLYSASQDPARLQQALDLAGTQIDKFTDPGGGFYDTSISAELLVRMKEPYDGVEPSGNSVAALNFLRLSHITGDLKWQQIAEKTILSFAATLSSRPDAMPMLLSCAGNLSQAPRQIVIAGDKRDDDTRAFLREIHTRYLPDTSLIIVNGDGNHNYLASRLEFIKNVKQLDNRATAYLCENFSCKMPVTDPKELGRLLDI